MLRFAHYPIPRPGAPLSAHAFDARAITDTIQRALASAGLDAQSGPMKGVTDTIQQALSAAGLYSAAPGDPQAKRGARTAPYDIPPRGHHRWRCPRSRAPQDITDVEPLDPPRLPNRHVPASSSPARSLIMRGTRTYKLYVPASYAGELGDAVPMVRDVAWLHAVSRRLRRRHTDECACRAAWVSGGLSRSSRQCERIEVLELVPSGRSGPRPRRAFAHCRHHA